MRYTIQISILGIVAFFLSCSKSGAPAPATTPTPPSNPNPRGPMKINLTYPVDSGSQTYELIITQPEDETILLDTVATLGTKIIATLNTKDSLVDVSNIRFIPTSNYYSVNVFKGVNASALTTPTLGSYRLNLPPLATTTPANITYINLPVSSAEALFTNFPGNEFTNILYENDAVQISYNQSPGNYAYLLFPESGRYNLHMPTSTNDTVDLSNMDTAISLTFNRPYPFWLLPWACSFIGIPDTTNLSQVVSFTALQGSFSEAGVDMEYPKIPVENYELWVTADEDGNFFDYYYYGKNIPTTLDFPTASDFYLESTQPSGFSVAFPGKLPTFYKTQWNSANVVLNIFASPDNGSLSPITWLFDLHSKLLSSVTYTDLTLKFFEIDDIPGMNYAVYTTYASNPAAIATRVIRSASNYFESF